MMYGLGGTSTGLMIGFGIGQFLLFLLFVYIVYRVVKQKRIRHNPAIEQLKVKFVNGEITEEEYQSKADFLRKQV